MITIDWDGFDVEITASNKITFNIGQIRNTGNGGAALSFTLSSYKDSS